MQIAAPTEKPKRETEGNGNLEEQQPSTSVSVAAASSGCGKTSTNASPLQNSVDITTTGTPPLLITLTDHANDLQQQEDNRIQPWQCLIEEIERQDSLSPLGSDYFPCHDGFFAHSLAG